MTSHLRALALAIASVTLAAVPTKAALIDGLQAYYTFDTNATDDHGAFDGTPTANTGTVSHTASGRISGGYDFTGNAIIDIGQPMPIGNAARAISMWVMPRGSSNTVGLFTQSVVDLTGQNFNLVMANTNNAWNDGDDCLYLQRYFDDAKTTDSLSFSLGSSTWYHIVLSYDGTSHDNVKFYVDGTLVPTDLTYGEDYTFNTAAVAQSIGGAIWASNSIIDEVGIWNRALTAQDVADLYNSGSGMQVVPVPEPSAALLVLGLSTLVIATRRRR